MRIAVMGGGVAGLTAAAALRRHGFTDVVVFEARGEVGGKVRTMWADNRPYELGAYITLEADEEVRALLQEKNIPVRDAPPRMVHDLDIGGDLIEFTEWQEKRFRTLQTVAGVARYTLHTSQHKEIYEPGGFKDADPELFQLAAEYFDEEGLDAVMWLYKPIMAGLGYGFFEELPALYASRFVDPAKIAVLARTMFDKDTRVDIFSYGFQSLWEAVAKDLDVRLNTPIERVQRSETEEGWRVEVTAGGQVEVFDRLIVTPSTPRVLSVLDATPDEVTIYDRLRFYPYLTTLFRATGLAQAMTAYIGQHARPHNRGRLMIYSQPHADRDLYLGWQYGERQDAGELAKMLAEDVQRVGGTFEGIVHQEFWPEYFPHVDSDALRAGHFMQLDRMQGTNGTYYAGAHVDYELTGTAAAWANRLVERFFRSPRDVQG